MKTEYLIILLAYLCLNTWAFFIFAHDKRKAVKGRWRTNEKRMLFWGFLGPFGAYGAMKLFRHKTQKTKFVLVPGFLIMHVALFIFVLLKVQS